MADSDVGGDDALEGLPETSGDDASVGAADGGNAPVSDASRSYSAPEVHRLLDEQRDKYLRLAAEYDNFRKRNAKERLDAGPRAQADLVKTLIDALDDLARVAHVDAASTDAAGVIQGVDLVEKKMLKTLGTAGLEVISPIDEPFDPALHEAIATVPAMSSEDDHMIAQVYQQGYLFKGQLLRPARVVVKQWNG
ncbi:MAG: nucleotide exchange factor GrpE [Gemmatimonadaceae bacterium]